MIRSIYSIGRNVKSLVNVPEWLPLESMSADLYHSVI